MTYLALGWPQAASRSRAMIKERYCFMINVFRSLAKIIKKADSDTTSPVFVATVVSMFLLFLLIFLPPLAFGGRKTNFHAEDGSGHRVNGLHDVPKRC
jgi:hypothetical protein